VFTTTWTAIATPASAARIAPAFIRTSPSPSRTKPDKITYPHPAASISAVRTLEIRYTNFRSCPNCGGRGDDGAAWRPIECKRCKGHGKLVTGVELEDSVEGILPDSRYDFNALGEVFLIDFDEDEEVRIIRPQDPWG